MSRRPDNFRECLAYGQSRERAFCLLTGANSEGGRKYDVRIPDRYFGLGGSAEIKSDRTSARTGNYSMKRISNLNRPEALAGPWKAAALRLDWYILDVPIEKQFWFLIPGELVRFLDTNLNKFRTLSKATDGDREVYAGMAYLVPVDELRPLIRWVEPYEGEDQL